MTKSMSPESLDHATRADVRHVLGDFTPYSFVATHVVRRLVRCPHVHSKMNEESVDRFVYFHGHG